MTPKQIKMNDKLIALQREAIDMTNLLIEVRRTKGGDDPDTVALFWETKASQGAYMAALSKFIGETQESINKGVLKMVFTEDVAQSLMGFHIAAYLDDEREFERINPYWLRNPHMKPITL